MTDINRTACTFSRPALNANTLKLIAVLAMVLDHAATVFLADTAPAALFFHAVGQIAAPVWVRLLLLGLCCLLAYPANWNYIAVLWIFGFAVFRESPKKQWAFFGLVTLLYVLQYFVYGSTLPVWLRPFVLLCVPLLLCYNHTLGRRSKVLQWGYYLFYPAHLLVLTLLREIFTRL